MQQILRDTDGKTIGYIRDQGDMSRLFNRGGKLQGWFNKKTNVTFNAAGSIVARCNVLVSLLKN